MTGSGYFKFHSIIRTISSLSHNSNIWKRGIWRSTLHTITYKSRPNIGKRCNFNIKHVSLTLDTQERTGTLHFRCLDVLNILMSGVPEIWSRQNSKGKFSTFMPLIFSKPRRRGTKPNKTHYHLINCRLLLPCPFGKQIYQNVKWKILKFFERPLGLCFFKNLFSSSFCK